MSNFKTRIQKLISLFAIALLTLVAATAATAATAANAGQSATTTNDTPVWSEPKRSSSQLTTIDKNTDVEIIKRKGGWYRVRLSDNQEGWIPLLKLRFLTQTAESEESISDILQRTAQVHTGTGVTSGVRGMTKGDIEIDREAPGAKLEELANFIPTDENVDQFAKEGKLRTQPGLQIETE